METKQDQQLILLNFTYALCFMETKQDQQLILLGKYIENLFKHRITLSLDAK